MLNEIRSGATILSDGTVAPARATRIGGTATAEAQGRYYEQTVRGNVFTLSMPTGTTTLTAGNILSGTNAAPAAAASAQFALWNPTGSGKNLSLLKFGIGIVSCTFTAAGSGGVVHVVYPSVPTIASTTTNGILSCNNAALPAATVARGVAVLAGQALTGGPAGVILRLADFAWAGVGAYANVAGLRCIEYIDGDIVLPPGTMWTPCFQTAETNSFCGFSITWEEIPV